MSNFRNSKASFKTNGRTLALGMGSGFSARTRAIVAIKPIDPANNSLFIFGSSNLTYRQAKLIALKSANRPAAVRPPTYEATRHRVNSLATAGADHYRTVIPSVHFGFRNAIPEFHIPNRHSTLRNCS